VIAIGIWIDRDECVRVRGESKRCPGVWEGDDDGTAFDRGDTSNSQLRVEPMREMVSRVPVAHPLPHCDSLVIVGAVSSP